MRKEDGTYRTYDEMVADGIDTKVQGQWVATYCADHPVDQATAQGDPFSVYMYTLFLPEVCVDTQTGKVTVEKFTCVADVGTIMNRLLVDGNFYGGLAQGIGLALTEDFDDLSKHTSLKNCGIPYPKDVPDDIAVCPQLSPQCRNVLGHLSGGLGDVGRARQLGGIAVKLGEQVSQVLGPHILLQGGYGGLGDLTGHGVFLAVFVVSHTGPTTAPM